VNCGSKISSCSSESSSGSLEYEVAICSHQRAGFLEEKKVFVLKPSNDSERQEKYDEHTTII
jgi:hypothetical protein